MHPEYGIFPSEGLDQGKHFGHYLWGSRCDGILGKCRLKSIEILWFLQKKCVRPTLPNSDGTLTNSWYVFHDFLPSF